MHLTSTTGGTNWTAAGIVAPPTTFNAHLRLTPAGEYVLFFRNSGGKLPPTNWETLVCNGGISDAEWAALVAKGPYISADKLTDSVGNFVAKTHNMLSGAGGWTTTPFTIVGQEATCGNKSIIDHNSNPSAVVLPSGYVRGHARPCCALIFFHCFLFLFRLLDKKNNIFDFIDE